MTGATNTKHPLQFPQQGNTLGWTLWVLLCLLSLLCLPAAHAGTFSPGQTTFTATAVSATSAPVLVTLTAQASGAVASTTLLTEGSSTPSLAEFSLPNPNAGTCGASPTLSPGQSCTVSVVFTPRLPGMRHGAVVLKTSGGSLLASTLLSGVGQGGLPVLNPGQINTVVGNGQWFYQTDNVPATQASIYLPSGLAVDAAGNLFLADTINNRVRRVDAVTQNITTVAGNGSPGTAGDNGPATSAEITSPGGLALDGAGNLYIADTGNNTIRRVDATTGIITTVAGTPGAASYTGDGAAATSATLNAPQAIALAPNGDLVIADTSNAVIRVVTFNDGKIQTIAGTGAPGYNGDNINAHSAQLYDPSGVAIRADGAVAIADLSNNRVRLVSTTGVITTLAGNGSAGYSGDSSAAINAELQGPAAVVFDPAGDLIIADSVNNCIRLVYSASGTITTLAGTPTDDRFAGDGGPDNQARMHGPDGLFFDATGNLWLSDRFNNRIREVNGSLLTIGPYPTMKVGKTSQPVLEAMINAGNAPLAVSSPTLQQAALDSTTTTCAQTTLATGASCTMGDEFAPTNVGPTINGSITWNTDAPNVTPIDQLFGQVLSVEPTTVAITSSVNPGLVSQPVTLTATVTSADTGRTGTVTFTEGSTTWCPNITLNAAGAAACTIPSLSLGTHSFIASYSGDNNNAASQSPAFVETIKQQAALALNVSTSPVTVTNNVTLTLQATDNSGTPTGNIVFYDGATALATVALDSNGNAAWSSSSFTVGSHSLTAQYAGDTSNVAGTSNTRVLQVNPASTVTVLGSGNNNATVGASVPLTANVVSNNGPAPTGSVQFFDGATSLGSAPLNNGSAALATNTLTPGAHTLTAIYSGDTDNATSTSAPITETVQQIATVTTLGADTDPLSAGATVHFSAIVNLSPGQTADGALTGSVTFTDGNTTLGSAPLNASGQATLAISNLTVGNHPIIAHFNGSTNYAPSNSTALTETVQQTATATTLSTAATTTLMGKPASFTTTVTSATGTPTGSIAFKDGQTLLGTATLDTHGAATFSTTALSAGNHQITAVYSGDANYLTSISTALQQTVNLAQTTLSLAGPTSATDAGLSVQLISALATPGVTPTGTLTLLDGSIAIGSLSVTATGSFTFATNHLAVGTHTLTASYSGDTNNSPVQSAAVTVIVQQAPTSTSLIPSANPLTQGQPLTLTATVTSPGPSLTGAVTLYDGSTLLGTAALSATGAATFTPQSLALGNHILTAVYTGDANHATSTSTAVPELVVQTATLALSSSVNPSVSGQSVTFTGQVNGSPTPTGTLILRDNGTVLATLPLNATGAATFTTAGLSVGAHIIAFTYSGDTNFATITGQLTQNVIDATTTTTLAANANPATYGQPLSLTAAVASNGGAPTGTVNFTDAGTFLGSAQLNANAIAVFTTSTLSPGAHTITATYAGDGKASPSASQPLAVVVKQVTTLALGTPANPAPTLSAIAITATLTNPGAASATGSITFTEGSTTLGTAALDTTGHATLTLPNMTAGAHAILATYAGDGANFASQSATYNQVIQLRPTTTTVTGTATDSSNPQQMTLIAVVRGDGSTPPSGTVSFTSGSVTLGAAPVDATGVASITVIFDTPTQQVVASYPGDPSYAASQSGSTPITAGLPAQFTISVDTPDITLVTHQHTTVTVTLASIKGFTDQIALGCLGLPYAATCTYDKSQLKLNANGTATASLIIDTGDPLGAGSSTTASVSSAKSVLLCFSPAGLLAFALFGKVRRKRLPILLLLLLTFAVTGGLTGCSGLQVNGTPPGTYSFRVIGTGQGSNITESQTITLVVTQ